MENEKNNQQIIDDAYELYYSKAKEMTTEELFDRTLSGVGEIIDGMLEANTRDFRPYTKEEFINKIKTNKEFSENWQVRIQMELPNK